MPVTLAVPPADGMKVTEQVPANRVQVADGVKLPEPVVTTKPTVPVGVVAPAPAVSVTVTLQGTPTLTVTIITQITLVEVERRFTVMGPDVPELEA